MPQIRTIMIYFALFVGFFIASLITGSAFTLVILNDQALTPFYGILLLIPVLLSMVASSFWKRHLKPKEISLIWAVCGFATLCISAFMTMLNVGGVFHVIGAITMCFIILRNLLARYSAMIKLEASSTSTLP